MIRERIMLKELLKEWFVAQTLNERGVGSTAFSEEVIAKAEWEAATRALEVWHVENNKKKAFLEKCRELKIKPDSAQAKKLKAGEPKLFAADPKILQKTQQKLTDDLAAAKKKLGDFDPTFDDEPEALDKRGQKIDIGKSPDPKKKQYAKVSDIKPLQLYLWNDKRWSRALKIGSKDEVSLGFKSAKGEDSHPGEERLAIIFGAEEQGDSTSFDLVDQSGAKWEVKGIKSMAEAIRPGQLGVVAFEKAGKDLKSVCEQIKNFVKEVSKVGGPERVCTTESQLKMMRIIRTFLNSNYYDITRFEISRDRLVAARKAFKAIRIIKAEWEAEEKEKLSKGPEQVRLADKELDVSRQTFIAMTRRANKELQDNNLLDAIDARERCLYWLVSQAFKSPDKWLDGWEASINIKKIFADVTGLFIVTPQGFYKIPQSVIPWVLHYSRTSQKVPRYTFDPTSSLEPDEGSADDTTAA